MRLKCIKLAGFKSFVDPTTVNLPGSLCAVVGPNGCGKSNIIDAVRWVMGEISAKHLRGESMADVIFNGSGSRKPVAQATIELVFDNTDGSLGGQYAAYGEISVKRRVSRDGQSTYYLNGSRCRRRDVTDIFTGTGLGPRSYAIIEQGTISRLIESRPEDLRVYIEEAAGISRYKERRRDTEQRIARARENLERLTDVREELGRQLERLRRQAAAAEKYRALKAEERQLRAQYQAMIWRDQDERAKALESEAVTEAVALERLIAEREAVTAASERLRATHLEASDHLNEAQRRFYAAGAEVAALEQRIQHAGDQARRQRAELEQLEHNLAEAHRHLEEDRARGTAWAAELGELRPLRTRITSEVAAAEQHQREAEVRVQDSERLGESSRGERAQIQRQADALQARVNHLDTSIARVSQRLQNQRAELAGLMEANPEDASAELDTELARQEQRLHHHQLDVEQMAAELAEQRRQQTELAAARDAERDRLQLLQGRRAGLITVIEAARDTDADNGAALTAWSLDRSPRLVELLGVEDGWELAVETVLGGDLQACCTDGLDPLREQFDALTRGRLCLLEKGAARTAAASSLPWLADKLTGAQEWAAGLLAGVHAAEDLDAAWNQRHQFAPGESAITREGIWFGSNWVRLARGEPGERGELLHRRDLVEVEAEIATVEPALAAWVERHAAVDQVLLELEARRRDAERAVAEAQREYAEVRARQSAAAARRQQRAERRERLSRELEESEALRQHETAEIGAARRELEVLLDQLQTASTLVAERVRERDACREALGPAREEVRRLRGELHQVELRERSLSSQLDALRQGVARLEEQCTRLAERQATLTEELAGVEAPMEALQHQHRASLEARLATETALGAARAAVQSVDAELRESETARVDAEQRVEAQRGALERLRLDTREARTRADAQKEQLHGLGAEPEAVLAQLPEGAGMEPWREQLESLDRRVQRLGPINLAALDECRREEERKGYLDAQDAELRDALDTLEEAIRKIDRETRSRFKDTFDRVNASLQALFPKLFGGGRASLELTGDDLLNTGITVMAQPPGKRNATIHLLSGGEKALTAIALVFAIFELNPAPFCMLDEVDAPLDDINAERYARLVSEMSEKVQFVFITHNKISMEIAGQLLGVTMQEPGVSRLVAVDVDEAVRLAGA